MPKQTIEIDAPYRGVDGGFLVDESTHAISRQLPVLGLF